jgi:hypothetical protein
MVIALIINLFGKLLCNNLGFKTYCLVLLKDHGGLKDHGALQLHRVTTLVTPMVWE